MGTEINFRFIKLFAFPSLIHFRSVPHLVTCWLTRRTFNYKTSTSTKYLKNQIIIRYDENLITVTENFEINFVKSACCATWKFGNNSAFI